MPPTINKRKVGSIIDKLAAAYPDVVCALDHGNAYELLVATILSAQCTDKRVNMVTPALFARYATPQALAEADPAEVEELIRSTGFFRNKTKSIIGMARAVVGDHQGEIPRDFETLVALPGVARKTANVITGTAFGIPTGIVVDTHVTRITGLLGLTHEKDPVKIEHDLVALVPKEDWINFGHRIIHHGRRVCIARRPQCDACNMKRLCPSAFAEPQARPKREKSARKTPARKTRRP
ncbi:MAG: endonuclease III [Myxococcota bacterium]